MTTTLQKTSTFLASKEPTKTTRPLFILDAATQPIAVTPPPSMMLNAGVELVQNTFYDVRDALKMVVESPKKPVAIIINYAILRQFSFYFAQQIRQNPLLQNTPLIAIANEGEWIDLPTALKSGVDDCYTQPIRWEMMEKRIEFLTKFRPQIEKAIEAKDNINVYAIEKISFGKRAFDIIVASTGLVLLSPLFLITAAMIKIESGGKGPVFYSQKRAGRNYQVFNFWKFRSMYVNADQRVEEMKKLNQYQGDDATFLKVKNDPRITKVGRIIRKGSIDELPQLVNILAGEMSIVGNRPLPLYEAAALTRDQYSERFATAAGLTGLWQVAKRGSDDMSVEERIMLDVSYARKNNFLIDFKLFLKTFTAFIQKENV